MARVRVVPAALVAVGMAIGGCAVAEDKGQTEIATLGGGCFWCMEAVFERIDGVLEVVSGYAGGNVANPTYEQVCAGATGHAEVVQIQFDPTRISYEQILAIFWRSHDPTTLNRQGADVGTQYRSIVLYSTEDQKKTAERSKPGRAVTEIVRLREFYPAEQYHQDYYDKNPAAGYCSIVIAPKLRKLELPVAPLPGKR